LRLLYGMLAEPTRYEQGPQLITQRWGNLLAETGIAILVSALSAAGVWLIARRRLAATAVGGILLCLYLGDVGRVNAKFLFLVDEPQKSKGVKSPVMEFLAAAPKEFRAMPIAGDPMQYASSQIPVMFSFFPVQQQRWQEFLDNFSFTSAMPDIINLKYLVYPAEQYRQEQAQLGSKYAPVFQSPDGSEVVLENRSVLPKGWLVPSVLVASQPQQALALLQRPDFDPRQLALVEEPPTLPLAQPGELNGVQAGEAKVTRYEGGTLSLAVQSRVNALLVVGEKYYRGWQARVDGKPVPIHRVDYILRGVYLPPGSHQVDFVFDPLPFKVGKYLTLASFAVFGVMLVRQWRRRRVTMSV
ncbi:MAG TPA: YfhO family protein, partial [Geobacteraceae bacterium]